MTSTSHAVSATGTDAGTTHTFNIMAASLFSSLAKVENDEAFSLMGAFHTDPHPSRVNLGAGIYCTDEGKSWPLKVVGRVEKSIHENPDIRRHDYLPIEGDQQFLSAARKLIFSSTADCPPDLQQSTESRIVSVQTISGSGANHIGARILAETIQPRHVWISDPTWSNHLTIWDSVGVPRRTYPYFNAISGSFDFTAMMSVLEREAQPRDILLLHACAHNPTGSDPTREQWMAIADLCQRKELFPFFDSAYQGFASGDPAQDAWAVRHFYRMQPPLEMCVAQSFSKNFGLYGQRVGAFHLVVNDLSKPARDTILANLNQMIRSEYSVSPRHGSDIVKTVLQDETLTKEWIEDLQTMSGRIRGMRFALYEELRRLNTPGAWERIIEQVGMFSYTGLTPSEVRILREDFHIYMLSSGRISIAGLNTRNVKYVAAAINSVRTGPSLKQQSGIVGHIDALL